MPAECLYWLILRFFKSVNRFFVCFLLRANLRGRRYEMIVGWFEIVCNWLFLGFVLVIYFGGFNVFCRWNWLLRNFFLVFCWGTVPVYLVIVFGTMIMNFKVTIKNEIIIAHAFFSNINLNHNNRSIIQKTLNAKPPASPQNFSHFILIFPFHNIPHLKRPSIDLQKTVLLPFLISQKPITIFQKTSCKKLIPNDVIGNYRDISL